MQSNRVKHRKLDITQESVNAGKEDFHCEVNSHFPKIAEEIQVSERNLQIQTGEQCYPRRTSSSSVDNVLGCIRSFEEEQMLYNFKFCSVCQERRLQQKMTNSFYCQRCARDKNPTKMFSKGNNMDPGGVPLELKDLTMLEEQLIRK